MKIMATSFKRSHAHTATLSVPNPAAGHHQPTTPLETPGHSQESLGLSLLASLLLFPGSWCAQDFVCALQESASPVLFKLPHNCTHLTHQQSNAQNSPSKASIVRELSDVQAGFRKGRRTRDQIANLHWIIEKARAFQKNIYFCFIDYTKAFHCVDHNNCRKF